jgi:hypothetical protein
LVDAEVSGGGYDPGPRKFGFQIKSVGPGHNVVTVEDSGMPLKVTVR